MAVPMLEAAAKIASPEKPFVKYTEATRKIRIALEIFDGLM